MTHELSLHLASVDFSLLYSRMPQSSHLDYIKTGHPCLTASYGKMAAQGGASREPNLKAKESDSKTKQLDQKTKPSSWGMKDSEKGRNSQPRSTIG